MGKKIDSNEHLKRAEEELKGAATEFKKAREIAEGLFRSIARIFTR